MAVKSTRRKNKTGVTGRAIFMTLFVLAAALVAAIGLNGTAYRVSFLPSMARVMGYFGFSDAPHVERPEGDAAVNFIDVGQGDCILISTDSKNVLIDCGEEDSSETVIRYLESRGVRRLDYVIATHPHTDHIGGMYKVLSAFSVGTVLLPELGEDMVPISTAYSKMLDVIEKKNIKMRYAKAGEQIRLEGGTYLDFLGPLHDDYDTLNNFSLVTKFTHGRNSFLLTGDVERAGENDLLNAGAAVEATVLKVAHHGSTSSSTPAFLKRVNPQYAVISVGRDNAYGHPMPEVLERLEALDCQLLTTAQYGHIVFMSDGGSLEYYTQSGFERKNIPA